MSFPFAISVAATIRINKLLAVNNHSAARMAAYLSLLEGVLLMSLAALAVYYFASYVGYIFVSDGDVATRVEDLALWAAVFQIGFGVQAACVGVLRATSHQMDIAG